MRTRSAWVLLLLLPASLAVLAQGSWQEFSSPEGGFAALFPGMPEAGGNSALRTFTLHTKDGAYQVSYLDAPSLAGAPPEAVLDSLRDGNLGGDAVLLGEEAAPLQSYPGRMVRAKTADGKVFNWIRLLLVNKTRIFQLIVSSSKEADATDARRFLDSFRLTSPAAAPAAGPSAAAGARPQAFYTTGHSAATLLSMVQSGIADAAAAQRAAQSASALQDALQAAQAPSDLLVLAQQAQANYQRPPQQQSALADPPMRDFLPAIDRFVGASGQTNKFFYDVGRLDARGIHFASNSSAGSAPGLQQEQQDIMAKASAMAAACPQVAQCPPGVTQALQGIVPLLQRSALNSDDLALLKKLLADIHSQLALPGAPRP